ncbi:MAG: hypothetical protein ABI488_00130 [Polyangiaceae bacterium]
MNHSNITTQVSLTSTSADVNLRDARDQTIGSFAELNDAQRCQLACDAWQIGLRAVTNAHRLADEARLGDIGKTLLEAIGQQLQQHTEQQEQRIHDGLARYLDPESGQLNERLRQLVGEGGTLPHLLERQIGPHNSVLVETLVKHVGEQSPLFKKLSPTDSEGLLALMSERLQTAMTAQQSEFRKALDPSQETGAIGQFILRLRDELKRAEDDQAKQLRIALGALDTTKEDSLLNQLRRDTQQAREQLLSAINPALEGSPLALIQQALSERLERFAKTQQEQLEAAYKQNLEHQQGVNAAVERLNTKRSEQRRTTVGGDVFEDRVVHFVQQAIGHGYLVENTSKHTGAIERRKFGDAVIHFAPDHAFHGARVVLEAKREAGFTANKALLELADARKNREACVGIFVLAKSHAAAGFPTFQRIGHDILMTWDDENPATDPYLEAALMAGLALAVRTRSNADAGDIQALQKLERRALNEIERLAKIQDAAKKIRRQLEIIESETESARLGVRKMVDDTKKTLHALNVVLDDEEAERASAITVEPVAPGGLFAPANDESEALAGE